MKIKAATTKRLIKETIQNVIITDMACIILAHESEEYILRIVKKAIALLESDNEIREMNKLKPRKKLTADYVQRAIRGDKDND